MTGIIYHAQCITCGRYANHLRRVREYATKNQIQIDTVDTRLEPLFRERHVYWSKQAGADLDKLQPIVAIDGKATLLTSWK